MRALTAVARRTLVPAAVTVACLCVWAWPALAAPAAGSLDPAVRTPVRLTAGPSDQFLGALAPDGHTLYFVSSRNSTAQVFRKEIDGGTAELVFDEGADVSLPRISPDGTRLLYISTRDDAGGDVCIRRLRSGLRRCLTGPGTAEAQAFWFPDGKDIGVVGRRGLHGDLQLRRVGVRVLAGGSVLVRGNVAGPAISPDGRWLVWLPLARTSKRVGISFAMKARGGLALRPVGGGEIRRVRFELPGATSAPAFSTDGRWIYFSQYLSDTNFDGRIDGEDHAVLFRARFFAGRRDPLAGARPEQLTSARWNCQYPRPAAARLVMTCNLDGHLDVYELPLDGAVPSGWSPAKHREALAASRDRWERLLLLGHLLEKTRDPARRHALLVRTTRLHLELGEHASAKWYARRVGALGATPDARRWASVVEELVAHRHEERLLDRGELDATFVGAQRKRLGRLARLGRGASADSRALIRLVMLEIHDVIGEEKLALAALDRVQLTGLHDPFALFLYADRAIGLLRRLGLHRREVESLRILAGHPSLLPRERLDMSRRLVHTLTRGRDRRDRVAAIEAMRRRVGKGWRKGLARDGEGDFHLGLEALLLELPDGATRKQVDPLRRRLFRYYRYHREFERRKALVAATMRAAGRAGSDYLMYQFANTWASNVSRRHAERDRAAALYRQVVLERAYLELARGDRRAAAADFFGVTLQMDDLEAHGGYIELAPETGPRSAAERYKRRYRHTPGHPLRRFAKACVLARRAERMRDEGEGGELLEQAAAELDACGRALSRDPGWHQLRGWVAHRRFLRSGDPEQAVRAHGHYVMALDLARGRPRYEAALTLAIAALQAAVGNHFIALSYLEGREKLPLPDPRQELAVLVLRARSLYHTGRATLAEKVATAALVLASPKVAGAALRARILDLAALCAYASGRFEVALRRYRELVAATAREPPANRLRAEMMAGASALAARHSGEALAHLRHARAMAAEIDDNALAAGRPRHVRLPPARASDLLTTIDGLRAEALRDAGRTEGAEAALVRRGDALRGRAEQTPSDGLLLKLAANAYNRATLARRRGHPGRAAALLERALGYADRHAERTGTAAHPDRVRIALAYAALALHAGLPHGALRRDPLAVLRPLYAAMCAHLNPARAAERFELELYLAMLAAGR